MSASKQSIETQLIDCLDGITIRIPVSEDIRKLTEACRSELIQCLGNVCKVLSGKPVAKRQLRKAFLQGEMSLPSAAVFKQYVKKRGDDKSDVASAHEALFTLLFSLENYDEIGDESREHPVLSPEQVQRNVKMREAAINSVRATLEIPFVTPKERELLKNGDDVPDIPEWFDPEVQKRKQNHAMRSLVPPEDDAEEVLNPIIEEFGENPHPSQYANMIALLNDEINEWKMAEADSMGDHASCVLRILYEKKDEWRVVKRKYDRSQKVKNMHLQKKKEVEKAQQAPKMTVKLPFDPKMSDTDIISSIIQPIVSFMHPEGSSQTEILLNQISGLDMKIVHYTRYLGRIPEGPMKARLQGLIQNLDSQKNALVRRSEGL